LTPRTPQVKAVIIATYPKTARDIKGKASQHEGGKYRDRCVTLINIWCNCSLPMMLHMTSRVGGANHRRKVHKHTTVQLGICLEALLH
jgi:hypothetical protein